MNLQTKITGFAFMLALVGFSYGLVAQDKANVGMEYYQLELANQELEKQIQDLQQQWWDYEEMKQECIDSYNGEQSKVSKEADKKRQQKENNEFKKEGLIKRSQPQKKINDTTEGKSIMNDTDEKTTDNKWYKKLLKWVGLT